MPAIPRVLYVHGAVLTLWFLFTVLQGWLIRTQRLRLHRQVGYVAAGYATFVSLAVVFRKKPDAHRRLTLLASISIVGPALARFPMWPMFAGGVDSARNYGIGGLLLLFASLIGYDVILRRRPHPASWIGAVAIVVGLAVSVFLAASGKGFEILHG